jgi:hypothetical protein
MVVFAAEENVLVSGRLLKSRVPDACKSQLPLQDQRFSLKSLGFKRIQASQCQQDSVSRSPRY